MSLATEKQIDWALGWNSSDDFLHFAFGDFNSKNFASGGIIYRTSQSGRYSIDLAPQTKDVIADVQGREGQYYFGTFHQPKVFEISFAFDNLNDNQIRELKKKLSGKELKELTFSESCSYSTTGSTTSITDARIYIAKITSQPNIKTIAFDNIEGNKVYKGEGSIQLTAYWPYARGLKAASNVNTGDVPTFFEYQGGGGKKVNVGGNIIEADESIIYWNSRTGVVKGSNGPIMYIGNGVATIQVGGNIPTNVTCYNWYY